MATSKLTYYTTRVSFGADSEKDVKDKIISYLDKNNIHWSGKLMKRGKKMLFDVHAPKDVITKVMKKLDTLQKSVPSLMWDELEEMTEEQCIDEGILDTIKAAVGATSKPEYLIHPLSNLVMKKEGEKYSFVDSKFAKVPVTTKDFKGMKPKKADPRLLRKMGIHEGEFMSFKDQLLNTLNESRYDKVDVWNVLNALFIDYANEAEHQDGREYWDQFSTSADVLDDLARYGEDVLWDDNFNLNQKFTLGRSPIKRERAYKFIQQKFEHWFDNELPDLVKSDSSLKDAAPTYIAAEFLKPYAD